MEGGLLSLKWNDHSHTFFDMLSTIRRKESYCDVTLISDGRYYKVHKLVLSTCSDFFDNLFSRTDCKHPVVIIANVSYKDLEALLNYMYLGEVNVLQTELANLMKAAEVLRIKGLAEPTKAPTKETKDNRRSTYSEVVDSSSKRKRLEDSGNPSAKRSSPLVVLDRPDSVESGRSRVACDPLATTDVVPTSSKGPSTREAHREPGISSQEDDWDQESNEKAVRPEVKVEDPILIKDEPGNSNWYSDPANDEGGDSLHYNEADTSLEYTAQSMDYSGSCLPWELSAANQPHPVEGHLPQGMPGASGMQGDPLLARKRTSSKKWRKLGDEERARLFDLAKADPKASSERLRTLLLAEFNIDISARTIRRELIDAGVKPSKPASNYYFHQILQYEGNGQNSVGEAAVAEKVDWDVSSNTG